MQYVSARDRLDDRSLDVCIVEGIVRDACPISAILKMPVGGVRRVDDGVTAAAIGIRV